MARKSLRCRVGWHRWAARYTDDGHRFLACRRCGKQDEPPEFYPPSLSG